MKFSNYSGTAAQYIREYLDPDNTLGTSPTSENEARELWRQLEEVFAEDGGTGIDEEDFVEAIAEMQTTSTLKTYRCNDEAASETIQAESMEEALEAAADLWADGSWDTKCVVSVRVVEIDEDGNQIGDADYVDVECGEDEPEPDCVDDEGHDWQAPLQVVGGLDSNPGVWSAGGTTIVAKTCCSRCGRYRVKTYLGSQRNPGEVDTVEYRDADECSAKWVESVAGHEAMAYRYAVDSQGFTGTFADWQALDSDEREAYDLGAQGIGTV